MLVWTPMFSHLCGCLICSTCLPAMRHSQITLVTFVCTLSCSMCDCLLCVTSFLYFLTLYSLPALTVWELLPGFWPVLLFRLFCFVVLISSPASSFALRSNYVVTTIFPFFVPQWEHFNIAAAQLTEYEEHLNPVLSNNNISKIIQIQYLYSGSDTVLLNGVQ